MDVDSSLKMKVTSIFKFFQQISSNHSEILKVGKASTIDKGICWVLINFRVHIYKYPHLNDELVVATHPGEDNGLLFPRYYQIYSKKGELLVSGSSTWVTLDINTHRLLMRPFGNRKLPHEHHKDDIPLPTKINESFLNEVEARVVRLNDTDLNAHLNNTKYVDYILDTYDSTYFENKEVEEIIIHYEKEVKEKQIVHLHKLDDIIIGVLDDKVAFKSQLIMRKRNDQN